MQLNRLRQSKISAKAQSFGTQMKSILVALLYTNHEATVPPTCGVITNKSDVKLNNFDFTCGKVLANGDIPTHR